MLKYTFLSKEFYNDYPLEQYPQLEQKDNRPYAHVFVDVYGVLFAIPLRSNVDHPHAFFTDKRNKCGVDYSKSVVILKEAYIDNEKRVRIRQNEFDRLRGKGYTIKKQFIEYIELYKQAKIDETVEHREEILKFSSLQYFEEYIYRNKEESKEIE